MNFVKIVSLYAILMLQIMVFPIYAEHKIEQKNQKNR